MPRNNLLLVIFESPNLQDIIATNIFKAVPKDSFERNLEYEITGVQKGIANMYAWIVAVTSNQATKSKGNRIHIQQEILQPILPKNKAIKRRANTPNLKDRRDCLKLYLYKLPKCTNIEIITHVLKEKMEAKNVVDIYYHVSNGQKHSGKANMECLNPIVYRQFLDKYYPS